MLRTWKHYLKQSVFYKDKNMSVPVGGKHLILELWSDNADILMNHELLLPGHLINMYLKEKIEELLINMKGAIMKDFRMDRLKSGLVTNKLNFCI